MNTSKPYKGLHTDNNPIEQPKDTYRYALNAVNESHKGDQSSVTNEGSNEQVTSIPEGFIILGDRYLEDNTSVLLLVNNDNTEQEIGLLNKDNKYETIVHSSALNFNKEYQIDITYRLRRGNERVIYWVDGLNNSRTFNLDRVHNFYTQAYQSYLQAGGDPNTYSGEKWDVDSFNLIKTYNNIPYFSDIEVLNYGNIKPGSYNFAIQYIDEDLNPTEWINVSNTVNIYNDSTSNNFEYIRGSYNLNDYQVFPEANKTIKLTISNVDTSFPYYRVAIIQATEGIGEVTQVLVSDPQSINVPTFIYSGNDKAFSAIDVNEIKIERENILKPKHIEQLENRLILANTEGSSYNWCEFQKYASKITSDLTTRDVIVNSVQSEPNVKNAKSTFFYRGYMPFEVYSFGIMYIMKDNSLSPVFHIPGKRADDTTSLMDVYEASYTYPDIHNCITNDYWGRDYSNEPILGQKVRHHRFPGRQEVGLPFIHVDTNTTPFTRYTITMRVTLTSDHVYPTDINDNPIIINYTAQYQKTGDPITNYTNSISSGLLGDFITIYSGYDPLDEIDPPNYFILDPTSDLMANYMQSGDEYFNIEYFYTAEPDDSISEAVESKIMGIQFSDIEKPHPDVIGFYIVRNEVGDEDKIVIDNCIAGPLVTNNNYKAFTHINPSFDTTHFDDSALWFFSPEVQYNGKQLQFNNLHYMGIYQPVTTHLPAFPDSVTSDGGDPIPGVYISDVQAGTSYDPSVNKKRDKDSDGFSLQCAYKATDYFTVQDNTLVHFPEVKEAFILNAAANKLIDADNYYNVSIDNKIGVVTLNDTIDPTIFDGGVTTVSYTPDKAPLDSNRTELFRCAMMRGSWDAGVFKPIDFAYQDFLTRPYYKEHMNPVYFNNDDPYNGFRVFNGDAEISGFNFITTMFRQLKIQSRRKKSNVWKYIIGAILIVVGAVAAIFTAGGSFALVGVGAGLMAAAVGLSIINSGIKSDQMIAMFDEDYSKGLLDCVEDPIVKYMEDINVGDDCIQWFSDRGNNMYIESRVPFGLRAGITAEIPDFVDGPGPYNDSIYYNYLVEKLTVFDRDQGGGRLYRGIATAEIYNCNPDYSRFNLEKEYIHLPSSYDCCFEDNVFERFPTRVWYSEQSFQEELTDNYRAFLPNNYRDIEGENGEITDLYKIGNSLFIHSKEALWQLPQNLQEKSTNELTTYIGTGDFFSIPPQKVIDDNLGSAGTQHKWGTVKTKYGVLSVSEIENKVYMHSQGITDLTLLGNRNFFKNNLKSFLSQELYNMSGVPYALDNNPANGAGVGYISCYDTRYERVLITKRDFSIIDTHLIEVKESITPGSIPRVNILGFNKEDGKLYEGYKDLEGEITYGQEINRLEDYPTLLANKSFTLSYSFHTNCWISFHSYLPNYYIHNQSNFYSFKVDDLNIYKHNSISSYQTFYETLYPHIIEYVSLANPLETKIWEDISFITTAESWSDTMEQYAENNDITHNKLIAYNSRQSTGLQNMVYKDSESALSDYLSHQVTGINQKINLDKNEGTWAINNLRDYVVTKDNFLFTSSWESIRSQYPIDKVVNNSVMNYNKDWWEIESLRDKYLIIRFIFDNFATVKLTTQFSIENDVNSER